MIDNQVSLAERWTLENELSSGSNMIMFTTTGLTLQEL